MEEWCFQKKEGKRAKCRTQRGPFGARLPAGRQGAAPGHSKKIKHNIEHEVLFDMPGEQRLTLTGDSAQGLDFFRPACRQRQAPPEQMPANRSEMEGGKAN